MCPARAQTIARGLLSVRAVGPKSSLRLRWLDGLGLIAVPGVRSSQSSGGGGGGVPAVGSMGLAVLFELFELFEFF